MATASVSSSSSSSNSAVQRLLDILRIEGRLNRAPNFSSALLLNVDRLSPDRFVWDKHKDTLKFQYKVTSQLTLSEKEHMSSLATYLAILDDVTTWALILSNPTRARPGVSVSLQAHMGPAFSSLQAGDLVEIIATVSKMGRHLGFVQAEIKHQQSGNLVCFGSHIKFLSSSVVTNILLSRWGWPFLNLYAWTLQDPLPQTFFLKDLFHSLDYQTPTRALFSGSDAHSSSGGPMHGGCQSIVMELVARQVAKQELASPLVHVEHVNVSYQSPAARDMEVIAIVVSSNFPVVVLRMQLRRLRDRRVVSEGVFRIVNGVQAESYLSTSSSYRSGLMHSGRGSWDTSTTRKAHNFVIYSVNNNND